MKFENSPDFDATAFNWVKDYHVLDYKDARFILFHYPILEWAHYYRKSAHLYGHIHCGHFQHPEARAINVGVDHNDFYPISAETIYIKAFGEVSSAQEQR